MRRATAADDTPEVVTDARRADDAVRSINHRTICGDGGLEWPSELEQAVRTLALMVDKLPQALNQLARIGEDFAREPTLYDDRGKDPRRTIAHAATDLDVAIRAAQRLAAPLDRAANELSHLGIGDD
ncbi:hypothetical protein FDG2_1438 [Candidatus Protofrankia californiensis]|uniref:Uncharacterized protein n=1 Tax=Candidatus Protofrankia californiensis TaxID=1839754 RepID=A0A1C3NVP2_9ACTN|nr:hypothetical protein FDG2_1438 [Candidatus Protofrankia californiensis]